MSIAQDKGCLISKKFSLWLKSPKKGATHYPERYLSKYPPQGSDLASFWGDLSQSENLSEIKPLLMITVSAISKNLYMYLDKRAKVDI